MSANRSNSTKSTLLVGSEAFKSALHQDLNHAKNEVFVQSMTVEADKAGFWLADALTTCGAAHRMLLVDDYSRWIVNDRLAYGISFLFNSAYREEVQGFRRLLRKLSANGLDIFCSNPMSFPWLNYPCRNHKKIIVIDRRILYLGGINFSEHNFAWEDFMIRLEGEFFAEQAAEDILQTKKGVNQSVAVEHDEGVLYFLDGRRSKTLYNSIFQRLESASRRVVLVSPYVSDPLLHHLERLASKIEVILLTPEANNKSWPARLMRSINSKNGLKVQGFTGPMNHMKLLLLDDKECWFGSTNFDGISYWFEQEVLMIHRGKTLIQDCESLIDGLLSRSVALKPAGLADNVATWMMRGAFSVVNAAASP